MTGSLDIEITYATILAAARSGEVTTYERLLHKSAFFSYIIYVLGLIWMLNFRAAVSDHKTSFFGA